MRRRGVLQQPGQHPEMVFRMHDAGQQRPPPPWTEDRISAPNGAAVKTLVRIESRASQRKKLLSIQDGKIWKRFLFAYQPPWRVSPLGL